MNKNQITKEAKETYKDNIILNFKDGLQTIIYKTNNDYKKFVPVTLSSDKSKIVT